MSCFEIPFKNESMSGSDGSSGGAASGASFRNVAVTDATDTCYGTGDGPADFAAALEGSVRAFLFPDRPPHADNATNIDHNLPSQRSELSTLRVDESPEASDLDHELPREDANVQEANEIAAYWKRQYYELWAYFCNFYEAYSAMSHEIESQRSTTTLADEGTMRTYSQHHMLDSRAEMGFPDASMEWTSQIEATNALEKEIEVKTLLAAAKHKSSTWDIQEILTHGTNPKCEDTATVIANGLHELIGDGQGIHVVHACCTYVLREHVCSKAFPLLFFRKLYSLVLKIQSPTKTFRYSYRAIMWCMELALILNRQEELMALQQHVLTYAQCLRLYDYCKIVLQSAISVAYAAVLKFGEASWARVVFQHIDLVHTIFVDPLAWRTWLYLPSHYMQAVFEILWVMESQEFLTHATRLEAQRWQNVFIDSVASDRVLARAILEHSLGGNVLRFLCDHAPKEHGIQQWLAESTVLCRYPKRIRPFEKSLLPMSEWLGIIPDITSRSKNPFLFQ